MSQSSLFDVEFATPSDAVISDCGAYRYRLTRTWDAFRSPVNFIMLNPSTADASLDDPTIRRCIGYAKAWGRGGIIVTNLFALRSTDPSTLKSHADPVGPENDRYILGALAGTPHAVAAWGSHGGLFGRSKAVRAMLEAAGVPLMCLSRTKGGEPGHPLYLAGGLKPIPLEAATHAR